MTPLGEGGFRDDSDSSDGDCEAKNMVDSSEEDDNILSKGRKRMVDNRRRGNVNDKDDEDDDHEDFDHNNFME